MQFNEPREIADKLARQALEALEERKLSAHPDKYAVWYAYASGKHPELTKEIDTRLSHDGRIDDIALSKIYETYLALPEEEAELNAASERIQQTLEQVMAYVGSASKGTEHYGETLENFSGDIAKSTSAEELQNLVGNVLSETKEMLEINKKLEQQLTDSTQEIHKLREEVTEVRQEASTDGLTGLPNRKFFDTTLAAESEKATQGRTFLSLIITDVDHFKKFNDTYGHQLGDQVLRLVAATLKANVRETDTPARYGGEEFVVVLPNTTLDQAREVAEKIRIGVANKKLINRKKNMDLGKINLSLGVAEYTLGEPGEACLKRADDALYAAKRTGRNKVVTQTETETLMAQAGEK